MELNIFEYPTTLCCHLGLHACCCDFTFFDVNFWFEFKSFKISHNVGDKKLTNKNVKILAKNILPS